MGRKEAVAAGKFVLLLVIAVVLQVMVTSRITVLGVTADLFVILTVIMAVSRGSLTGAIFGFVAGLFADVAFMQPLGIHALIYLLVGYLVGMFVARFETASPWAVLPLVGVSSVLAQFVFGLFQYIIGPKAAFFSMIGTQMIPGAILDALFAVPIYLLLLRARVIPTPKIEPAVSATRSASQ